MTERRIPPTNRTCRGRTVPNHAAANPLTAARSVAAVVTVAALILVGFSAWRQWSLTSALTQAAREVNVIPCLLGAAPTTNAVVTVSYSFKGSAVPLAARAVMPCET